MSLRSHRFFADHTYTGGRGVRELPPPPWTNELQAELRFPYDVLERALPTVRPQGLRFYLTKEAYYLPEYGSDVVAVLLQEERSKVPVYARHVRAVIRNLQSRPFLGFTPHARMGRLEAVLAFEYARDWYTHGKSKLAQRAAHPEWPAPVRKEPLVIDIPLGYHSQVELPQVPMAERTLDMFFAGQIRHAIPKSDYRYYVSTSKWVAREQLWDILVALKKKGDWHIDLGAIAADQQKEMPQAFNSYSEKMMNSRICLSPRGAVAETFRSFEGLRAGCMVIGNLVPPASFLAKAPIHIVQHWSELEPMLKKYARNINFLEGVREKSLAFWNEHLSPDRIADYLADSLNQA
jgi:hypothetical protein